MRGCLFAMLLLILIPLSGCEDDDASTAPPLSVDSEINAARPYHYVYVLNTASGNWTFEMADGGPNNPFTDVYAESGYLVVVQNSGTRYFNLGLAKEIAVQPEAGGGTLRISY